MKYLIFIAAVIIFAFAGSRLLNQKNNSLVNKPLTDQTDFTEDQGGLVVENDPLSITTLRLGKYPGSDLVVEQTLDSGSNYQRYIVSYKSEGLKIYSLLTVPNGEKPVSGWPVIIFNHGYIPPAEYRTTERYIAYTDAFSRNGYVLLRPDYRGHGNSEGQPSGAYGSNNYTIDVLNALASMKKYEDADPKRIGMWGHSMGGFITLRNMVVSKDVKAGVIWAGVVASYPDLINNWRRGTFTPPTSIPSRALSWRNQLTSKYGTPEENPEFWNSISANSFLKDVGGPIQIHHGTADSSVPVRFSETLKEQLDDAGIENELYVYDGDDHNIEANFNIAAQRSVEFFDKYVKGGDNK
jgi:dipeptidyl aminopeptidase/acylaminoacyl peptidase